MERPHPAHLPRAPAHGFGPGQRRYRIRQIFGKHLGGGPPLGLDHCEVEFLALDLADFALINGRETGGLQEAFDCLVRCAHLRAFTFFSGVLDLFGQAIDDKS